MGIKIHFLDNESYGAEDFRNVFARLTTQGVALYKDNGTLIEDTQEAISSFVSPGVELYNNNACMVVAENGSYKVSEGCLWLSDGTSIAVDSDGYELEVEGEKVQYVYAESQPVVNSAAIVVSDTAGGSDTVPLATIAADGTVIDTRIFATTKVVPCSGQFYVYRQVTQDCIIDVGFSTYKLLCIIYAAQQTYKRLFFYNFKNGESITFNPNPGQSIKLTGNGNFINVSISGTTLPYDIYLLN